MGSPMGEWVKKVGFMHVLFSYFQNLQVQYLTLWFALTQVAFKDAYIGTYKRSLTE